MTTRLLHVIVRLFLSLGPQFSSLATRYSLLVLLLAVACTPDPPPPTPRPTAALPTLFPTPAQNAAPQFEEDPDDVEAAFHAEIEQVIDQAHFLIGAPCDRLVAAVAQDPAMVPRLHQFAETLKRMAPTDQALERQGTPYMLKQMDDALAELDQKVETCGATPR